MANTQSMCTSFLGQLLTGKHNFGVGTVRGTTAADTFNAALFLVSATVDASTTLYTGTLATTAMTGEVSGTGYTAGGIAVTNATPPASANTSATAGTGYWTPSASLVYTTVTLATAFDSVLIFNVTQGTAANYPTVSVHKFGSQTITAGTFTLTMPNPAAATALLRLATT